MRTDPPPPSPTPGRRRQARGPSRAVAWVLAAVVLLAGLGVTALLVRAEHRAAARQDAERLADIADARARIVEDAVEDGAGLLVAMASYPMEDHPSVEEFRLVTDRLLLDSGPLTSISYVVPVTADEIHGVEQRQRAEGQPTFQVETSEPDGEYHVVLFSGPGPAGVDGLDLAAQSDDLERAAATGAPVLTAPFAARQGGTERSVAIIVPVYRESADVSTVDGRADGLLGWGVSTVPVRRLLASSATVSGVEVRLSLRDPGAPGGEVADDPDAAALPGIDPVTVRVHVLDRVWTLDAVARPNFTRAGHAGTRVAVLGALASVAAAALVLALARQRYRLALRVSEAVAKEASSDRRFRAVFDNAPVGVVVTAFDGTVLDVNRAFVELFGVEPTRETIVESLHPDDLEVVGDALEQLRAGVPETVLDRRVVRPDGSHVWCRVTSAALPGEDAIVAIVDDISEERAKAEAAEELGRRRARFEAMVERSGDLVTVIDADGVITYASRAVAELFGLGPEEIVGMPALDTVHPDDRDAVAGGMAYVMGQPGTQGSMRHRLRRPDGGVRVVEVTANNLLHDPDVGGLLTTCRDVTETAAADEALRVRAFRDGLTGVATRDVVLERLGAALERTDPTGGAVALLFVDLDRFKQVNDRFGHAAGDALLVEVANRLVEAVRPGDVVARHGGDEFVVLLESVRNEREARAVAERARAALGRPVTLPDGTVVEPGASVGVALADGPTTADAMLRDADSALYRAKQRGRNRVEVFDEQLRVRALRRLDTELVLRQALEHDSLSLRFEPVVDVEDGGVIGAEARIRLALPTGELLSAAELLPVAQEAGLASALASESLAAACRAVVAWRAAGGNGWVGIDVTAGEVTHPTFVSRLAEVLETTGVEPGALRLELPVEVVLDAASLTRRAITAARALGVHIVLDGVGAELRALAALGGLQVDGLKLDLASLPDLVGDPVAAAVAGSVAEVAAAAGMPVVVVGADTAEHLEAVRRLGFRFVQGTAVAPVLDESALVSLGE